MTTFCIIWDTGLDFCPRMFYRIKTSSAERAHELFTKRFPNRKIMDIRKENNEVLKK